MSNVQGKAVDLKLLSRVLEFVKPYRLVFYLTTLITIVLGFAAPLRPILVQRGVDDYIIDKEKLGMAQLEGQYADAAETLSAYQDWRSDMLLQTMLLFVGVLVFEVILQFLQTYYANWLGQSVTIDLRTRLYTHVTGFRLKYFDNTPIGMLVTRTISDIDGISQIFSQGLLTMIGDMLKLIVVVVVMFVINWKLALVCIAPVPVLIIATRIFKNAIKKAFIEVRNQVSKLNTFVQEHVTGMAIVQLFNREKEEMRQFVEINDAHRKANIKSIWAYAIFFPVVELLSAASVALLIWFIVPGLIDGTASEGNLVQYTLFIFMLYRPIRQLADRFNTLQMGIVNADRVLTILDSEESIADTGTRNDLDIKGNIAFKDVSFAYNPPEFVLHDVSFEVKAGQTIAFVGATGAGKSSIINLLSRFYEYQSGAITIEGEDLRKFDKDFLRKNIAVVLQDVFLFSDSVMNNITLHDPSISREQVIEAAKQVGAHDFIMKLPGNYDYDVKERGAMLSVGQRQLIAFIRAYVYNPKILVLDEATSSVDTESEELIQKAIEKLTENRTSIVIAHRLSTVQRADKIIVLDKGRVIEAGSHLELIEQKGQYNRLFELQFQ